MAYSTIIPANPWLNYSKMKNRIILLRNSKANVDGFEYYVAICYVASLLAATRGTLFVGFPNLIFKVKLWKIQGLNEHQNIAKLTDGFSYFSLYQHLLFYIILLFIELQKLLSF